MQEIQEIVDLQCMYWRECVEDVHKVEDVKKGALNCEVWRSGNVRNRRVNCVVVRSGIVRYGGVDL